MRKYGFLICVLFFPVMMFAQTAEQTARNFVNAFMQENYDKALSYTDSSFKANVTPAALKQISDGIKLQHGKFKNIISIAFKQEASFKAYYVYTAFEKDSLDIKTVFNKEGKIVGMFHSRHPNDADYFIQSGNIKIPGTLLTAKDNNQKKLVILVHGSGPGDRDETLAKIKPFKDLAEGLLKKGISSYRYDKRTNFAPNSMPEDYSIDDEVTNDVLNIIKYFKSNDSYRNYKIYVIGHSLGAMMAPRIASKANGTVSGIVMMAGPTRQIETLLLDQINYLDSLFPSPQLDAQKQLIEKQVRYIHSQAFNQHSPKDSLVGHLPASYLISLKNYHPLQLIKTLNIPVYIIQGEKDYQVTMFDFDNWKKAARGKSNINFKSFPGLSHTFMSSEGVPSPNDYLGEKHIAQNVIDDICNWILTHE